MEESKGASQPRKTLKKTTRDELGSTWGGREIHLGTYPPSSLGEGGAREPVFLGINASTSVLETCHGGGMAPSSLLLRHVGNTQGGAQLPGLYQWTLPALPIYKLIYTLAGSSAGYAGLGLDGVQFDRAEEDAAEFVIVPLEEGSDEGSDEGSAAAGWASYRWGDPKRPEYGWKDDISSMTRDRKKDHWRGDAARPLMLIKPHDEPTHDARHTPCSVLVLSPAQPLGHACAIVLCFPRSSVTPRPRNPSYWGNPVLTLGPVSHLHCRHPSRMRSWVGRMLRVDWILCTCAHLYRNR